jgi:hypothetical protein
MAEEDEKKSSDFVVIREPRKPDFHLGFHVYPQIQSWYLLTYNPNPDYTTFQRWKMYETEDFREEDPTAEDHAEVESPSFGQTSLMDMLEDSQFASVQETLIREAYRNPLADLLVVCDDLRTEVLRCILGDEPGRSKGQREWDYYKVWCFPFPPPPPVFPLASLSVIACSARRYMTRIGTVPSALPTRYRTLSLSGLFPFSISFPFCAEYAVLTACNLKAVLPGPRAEQARAVVQIGSSGLQVSGGYEASPASF